MNAIAPIQITLALKEQLLQSQSPHVIFVSSRRGNQSNCIQDNYTNRYGYRTPKAALHSAVCALSQDPKNKEILFTIVHPGYVSTRMTHFQGITPEKSSENIYRTIEQRKKGDPVILINTETNKTIPW